MLRDEDDGEAATLFFYLGLAEAHARADKRRLPALTPEYQRGVAAFSRNFFRTFFETWA